MATILRSSRSTDQKSGRMVQPVAFSFADLSSRADDYLATIRNEAAKIVAEALEQAEKIRRESERAGRKAAEDAIEAILEDKVAKQMKTLRPAIDDLVARLDDARGAWQEHWEQAGIRLAVAIAERIVRRELAQRPDITLDFVREALLLANGSSQVVVKLNPSDYENLGKQAETLAASLSRLASTRVIADSTISVGGCVVSTEFGEIDQRLESQLARIAEELL